MTVRNLSADTVYVFIYDDLMYTKILDSLIGNTYEIVGAAMLPHHILKFTNGTIRESYATVKYDRDGYIEGVLYKMQRASYEILKSLYSDLQYSVLNTLVDIGNVSYGCRLFISHSRALTPQLPSKEYLSSVIAGAYSNGLSRAYTDYLTTLHHLNNNVKILKELV